MVEMDKRDKPVSYLKRAIKVLESRTKKPFILEVGCMRGPCTHDLDMETCFGCSDGHSTLYFARTGYDFWSVDINRNNVLTAKDATKGYINTMVVYEDGIEFLKSVTHEIDLLFLDAWDLELPESAAKHLEAFKVAEPLLKDTSLVLVDDTDLDRIDNEYFKTKKKVGGKSDLLAPYMEEKGWKVIMNGRQTMWSK